MQTSTLNFPILMNRIRRIIELWKMDVFNYMKILMHVLDLYVSWTTDGCNECAGALIGKVNRENKPNPLIDCVVLVLSIVKVFI